MFNRKPDYDPSPYDDDWSDVPASGFLPKWIGGIGTPLMLIIYAADCSITRQAYYSHGNIGIELKGQNAIGYATAVLSLGVFLHCHYFWGNIYHLSAYAVLGKIFSLIAFIGSLVFFIIHVGVLGN